MSPGRVVLYTTGDGREVPAIVYTVGSSLVVLVPALGPPPGFDDSVDSLEDASPIAASVEWFALMTPLQPASQPEAGRWRWPPRET